ncbi:pyridoxamine kinase [Clostridium sp.]|uniref:pyridoxamine kinase n=1 Tax=Clostridium sp. TaxID=1506 RepID=UPI003993294B
MYPMKKVMAIHDLSCYGRASLTTIIPIMSAMEIQVCPMPTAILSTHTGGFGKPAMIDLSNFLNEGRQHWKKINLDVQCIYTGYLGNSEQSKIIKDIVKDFKQKETLFIVDPVLGDDGVLYSSLDNDMVVAMRELVKIADLITPNITEVALLLEKSFEEINDPIKIESCLYELVNLGAKMVVITSAPSLKGSDYLDTISYNSYKNEFTRVSIKKINKSYPGTGDAFASVLIGKFINGISLGESAKFASEYIGKSVELSSNYDYEAKEGILLEKTLNLLIK